MIRVGRQRRPVALLENLGHGVLQQRQGSGLLDDVGDDRCRQAGLQSGPHRFGRAGDRLLELLRRHRGDHLRPFAQELRERLVTQRPVVEVGPQRREHADTVRVAVRRDVQPFEEAPALCVALGLGEQLLELIDHKQELGVGIGEEPGSSATQAPIVTLELLEQRGGRVDGDPCQRRLQLLEGVCSGCHLRDEPIL